MGRQRRKQGLLAAALAIALAACGSKINQENFSRIHNGMTEQEIGAILGEPTRTESVGIGPFSGTTSTWTHEGLTISVQFVNGKVAFKNLSMGS